MIAKYLFFLILFMVILIHYLQPRGGQSEVWKREWVYLTVESAASHPSWKDVKDTFILPLFNCARLFIQV